MESNSKTLPAYKDWSLAAVRLLQGPVYHDDAAWEVLLRHQSPLSDYFGRIGLVMVVDEGEGLAFVRQLQEDEAAEDYETLPKLFRRTRLSYEATLLCVLLREKLRTFEEDLHNQQCVVEQSEIFAQWRSFFPGNEDEVKLHRSLDAAFKKLESLKFIRHFGEENEAWEVLRILKARLTVAELERLKEQLSRR